MPTNLTETESRDWQCHAKLIAAAWQKGVESIIEKLTRGGTRNRGCRHFFEATPVRDIYRKVSVQEVRYA
jgi:hypothetical protein